MSFRYRNWVFRNCDVLVASSKVGLVGKNGCGKTTLLKLLDQQLTPQKGHIRVDGTTYMVDFNLSAYKSFWPSDLIKICERLRSFSVSSAPTIIDCLQLGDHLQTPIGELSLGTAKKVSLLMGFMSTADILLIDEPFESLDEESSAGVIGLLGQRAGDHVIVSHDRTTLVKCVDSLWTIDEMRLRGIP